MYDDLALCVCVCVGGGEGTVYNHGIHKVKEVSTKDVRGLVTGCKGVSAQDVE